jgi:hypothetical protein
MMSAPKCGQRAELAASLKQAGLDGESNAVVSEFRRDCSEFSADEYVRQKPYARSEDRDHLAKGMHSAGL